MYTAIRQQLQDFIVDLSHSFGFNRNTYGVTPEPSEIDSQVQEGYVPYYDGGFILIDKRPLSYLVDTQLISHTVIPAAIQQAQSHIENAASYAIDKGRPSSNAYDEAFDEYLDEIDYCTQVTLAYCDPAGNNNKLGSLRHEDLFNKSHRVMLHVSAGFNDGWSGDICKPMFCTFRTPDEMNAKLYGLRPHIVALYSQYCKS